MEAYMKRKFSFLAIGLLCAAVGLFAAGCKKTGELPPVPSIPSVVLAEDFFAQDFPAYLTMDGTTITGCDIDDIPDNLVIPEGVTEIGMDAFAYCKSLASVSIPASMMKIGFDAFNGCDNIKTVQYRGTLAQWCEMDNDKHLVANAKTIKMSDMADLKAMTALAIPDGVNKIGEHTFHDCRSLASVTIPEGVTEIGREAFAGCESLASVAIPASVTEIGREAFRDCKSLVTISIPASVTKIGYLAFIHCDNIKTVRYGGTLAQWCEIDNDGELVANAKTVKMSDVTDLKAMTVLAIPKGVTKIGEYAFSGCKSVADVTIPEGITKIGGHAFLDCTSLASVSIPVSVTEIGWDAFSHCESLASVTLPDSVTLIKHWTFVSCKSLKSVSIPEGVTEICDGAFQGCTSLAGVTIPASMRVISLYVFQDCTSLKEVKYLGTMAQWNRVGTEGSWSFKNVPAKKVACTDGEADLY